MEAEKKIQISILVPIFNEEDVIPILVKRLTEFLSTRSENIEIVFINDGSTDQTPIQLFSVCMSDPRFQCISLSRNFGHQMAITAGLQYVRADEAVFIIDADLQDPPELFHQFYEKLHEGYDVVYGIRNERKESSLELLLKIFNLMIDMDSTDLYFRLLVYKYLSNLIIFSDFENLIILSLDCMLLMNAIERFSIKMECCIKYVW